MPPPVASEAPYAPAPSGGAVAATPPDIPRPLGEKGRKLEPERDVQQVRSTVDLVTAIVRQVLRVVVSVEARALVGQVAPLQAHAPVLSEGV